MILFVCFTNMDTGRGEVVVMVVMWNTENERFKVVDLQGFMKSS